MRMLIFVALALGAQAVPPAPQQPAAARPASIHGRVRRPDGRPLARANVRLMPLGRSARVVMDIEGAPPFGSAVTDVEGAYAFDNVAPGPYRLVASKPGFLTMQAGQRTPGEDADPLAITEGQVLEHVDITLPRHSAIAGRVVDENGDPVEGASVRAQRVEFREGRYQLVDASGAGARLTNDQGRFRLFGLPPGRYFVSALVGQVDYPGPGMVNLPGYAPTFYPGTASAAGAQAITVGPSQDVAGVEFPLVAVRTARISGVAVSSTGEPITGGLTLRSSVRGGGVAPPMGAKIDTATGTFEFPNVAPGEYLIEVSKGRRTNYDEGEFAAQFVTVHGADVTGLFIRASRGSRVTGRVTLEGGSADPDAFVIEALPGDFDRAPSSPGAIARAEIHADWTFQMSGLNGPRRFRLTRAPEGWALKTVRVNGSDVIDSILTFGTDEQSLSDVEIVLTRQAAEIAGTAATGPRQNALDYSVVVFSADRQQWYPESRFLARAVAREGRFRVTGLPAGDYYVVAVDRVHGDEWQDPAVLEALVARATRQTLGEGQKLEISLKLTQIGR